MKAPPRGTTPTRDLQEGGHSGGEMGATEALSLPDMQRELPGRPPEYI